ncbi:MAG: ATP-binding protein [Planctomycetota bacterium]|jgi:PAS domain S-box-containing protein
MGREVQGHAADDVPEAASADDGIGDGIGDDCSAARALADAAPSLMWIADRTGSRIAFNDRWIHFRGRPVELETGGGWIEGVHPDDRSRTTERWRSILATRADDHLEYRLASRSGGYECILESISPQFDADGNLAGFLGCCTTITRHVEAFDDLLAHLPVCAIVVGSDHARSILHANPATLEVYGCDEADAIGRPVSELFGSDCESDSLEFDRAWQAGRSRFEGVHNALSGAPRPVEVHAHRITYRGDASLLVIVHHAGDRVRVERELEELREQVRRAQKLEAIGLLAAGVAHDFNNLRMAMRSCADLVRRELAPDHPSRTALDMIEQACNEVADATDSLVTFAGSGQGVHVPLDLTEVIGASIDLLERMLPASITVNRELPHEPVWVRAAPQQVQQCIYDLAINARDAMPNGGTIDVRLAADHDRGGVARITVEDDGDGMPPDVCNRIFEPFFTTKPHDTGAGLGLSVVREIIFDHGGRIECDSAVGRGARFGAGLVLLIEDDDFIRELLLTSLEGVGFTVATAADGGEALALVRARAADARLLVLDLDLPGRSGHACIEAIAADGVDLPILVMARDLEDPVQPATMHVESLARPFSMQEFIDKVSTMTASEPESAPGQSPES